MKNVLEKLKFKVELTEKECLKKINKAIESLVEDDVSSDEIVYIAVENQAAEQLFNELFEGITFQEYKDYFDEDETWEGKACDISTLVNFVDCLGEDIYYSTKRKEFYKKSLSDDEVLTCSCC